MASAKQKRQDTIDLLSKYICARVQEAKEARKNEGERIIDCVKQISTKYKPDIDPDTNIDITYNITAPIAKGIVSLLRDIVNDNIETPFVVKSTPIPSLPPDVEDKVVAKIQQLAPQMVAQGMDLSDIKQATTELAKVAYGLVTKKAEAAASACKVRVSDMMIEGSFSNAFKDFLVNLVYFPNAFLKLSTKMRKVRVMENGEVTYALKPIRTVENINPLWVFPAPDAVDIEEAEYVIEQRFVSRMDLEALKYIGEGYSKEQIEKAVESYPEGYFQNHDSSVGVTAAQSSDTNPLSMDGIIGGGSTSFRNGYYSLIGYYGLLRGDFLNLFGADHDPDIGLEGEVWMIGEIPIMARANPVQSGKRPFFSTSFEKIPGNFWGECPVTRLKPIHRMCVATVKRLIRNVGFASGPTGTVVKSRLVNPSSPELAPYKFNEVKIDPTNANANVYQFANVPIIAGELAQLMDQFVQWGYESIGIPRMALGSNTNLGSVGRTAGGMSMLIGQANKVIKQVVMDVEQDVIEPLVDMFIDVDMFENGNANLNGDVKAYSRSFSGLVEKEANTQDMSWILQSLAPLAQQGMVPPEAIKRILYNIMKNKGIDTTGVFPDYDNIDNIQELMESMAAGQKPPATGLPPPPGAGGASPSMPLKGAPPNGVSPEMMGAPPGNLDGRSEAALQAQQGAHLPTG